MPKKSNPRTRTSLIDLEIRKRFRLIQKADRKQIEKGFRITTETVKTRRSLQDFPETIGVRDFPRRFWTARIRYKEVVLLIEPRAHKKGPKLIARTTKGQKVELTTKTEKELLKEISIMFHDRKGGLGPQLTVI